MKVKLKNLDFLFDLWYNYLQKEMGKEFIMEKQVQLNKFLVDRYPYLLPRNVFTGKVVSDYNYEYLIGLEEIEIGWGKLFLMMCEDIRQPLIDNNHLEHFRFHQVKQKWGEMVIYVNSAPQLVFDIIDSYTAVSKYICNACGEIATKRTTGYVLPYCDKCFEECQRHDFSALRFNKCHFGNGVIELYDRYVAILKKEKENMNPNGQE